MLPLDNVGWYGSSDAMTLRECCLWSIQGWYVSLSTIPLWGCCLWSIQSLYCCSVIWVWGDDACGTFRVGMLAWVLYLSGGCCLWNMQSLYCCSVLWLWGDAACGVCRVGKLAWVLYISRWCCLWSMQGWYGSSVLWILGGCCPQSMQSLYYRLSCMPLWWMLLVEHAGFVW